jgi:hypothetical protein
LAAKFDVQASWGSVVTFKNSLPDEVELYHTLFWHLPRHVKVHLSVVQFAISPHTFDNIVLARSIFVVGLNLAESFGLLAATFNQS